MIGKQFSGTTRRFAARTAGATLAGVAAVALAGQLVAQAAPAKQVGTGQGSAGQGTNAGNGPGGGNNGSGGGNGGNTGGGATPGGKSLILSGVVTGTLSPGVSSTELLVTVQNPNSQAVILRRVEGFINSVGSGTLPGLPACDEDWFTIDAVSPDLRIARGASAVVSLPVMLEDTAENQDNCKSVEYSFTFSARADQA